MNISLTPHLEELVRRKVNLGAYNSISEVIREALQLLDERDRLREIKLEALRKDIQEGLDSGESTPLDIEEIKADSRKRHARKQQF